MAVPRISQPTAGRALAALLLTTTLTTLAFAPPASAAGSGAAPTTIEVNPAQVLTDTGVAVKAGESVTITAKGVVNFGGGKIAALTPAGIPRGPACSAVALNQPLGTPWPAPELACWSLFAKIGTGPAVEIGDAHTFTATTAGRLALGVNDNFADDNVGTWTVTITVSATPPPTTPPTTAGGAATGKKKSSSPIGLILAAVAVVAVLYGLWVLFAGRRKKGDDEAATAEAGPDISPENRDTAMASAPVPAPMPGADAPEPTEPLPAPTPSAPPQPDSIDVNIFEVEFTNGLTLRVGYNHFPEGTRLQWKVTQSRIPVASGHFMTKGGGSTNHVETFPLGVKLEGREAQPDGADVQFDWAINGVPFRYSVRRDPNC